MAYSFRLARCLAPLANSMAPLVLLSLLGACEAESPISPALEAATNSRSAASALMLTQETGCSSSALKRLVKVASSSSLSAALSDAQPGDLIQLANGTYSGHFMTQRSGTSQLPIILCGSSDAILNGGSISSVYGLHLKGASYWKLVGFTVTNAQKGIMLDRASHNILQHVTVHDIGNEGVHFRDFSSGNVLRDSHIYRTGRVTPQYGEGLYIGTAPNNWCSFSSCLSDASNANQALNNLIEDTAAESVDIKEGSSGGVVSGNTFRRAGPGRRSDGSRSSSAWVMVAGDRYTISGNTGVAAPYHGFLVISGRNGDYNIFRDNVADVQNVGYGIQINYTQVGNVVGCDNVVRNAAKGFSNVQCK